MSGLQLLPFELLRENGKYIGLSICYPGNDVINFEINLIFLTKPFICMTKKSGQNFKCLANKKR